MEIKGEWQFCEDAIVRPVIIGRIQTANGEWISARLLIDTGADRTVLSAIVDRPGNTVCLLSQRHRYEIIQD